MITTLPTATNMVVFTSGQKWCNCRAVAILKVVLTWLSPIIKVYAQMVGACWLKMISMLFCMPMKMTLGQKACVPLVLAGWTTVDIVLIGAGYNWVHEFRRLKESSCWFYPVEESEDSEMGALAGYQTKSLTSSGSQYTYKTNGFSVRCVMVE